MSIRVAHKVYEQSRNIFCPLLGHFYGTPWGNPLYTDVLFTGLSKLISLRVLFGFISIRIYFYLDLFEYGFDK